MLIEKGYLIRMPLRTFCGPLPWNVSARRGTAQHLARHATHPFVLLGLEQNTGRNGRRRKVGARREHRNVEARGSAICSRPVRADVRKNFPVSVKVKSRKRRFYNWQLSHFGTIILTGRQCSARVSSRRYRCRGHSPGGGASHR